MAVNALETAVLFTHTAGEIGAQERALLKNSIPACLRKFWNGLNFSATFFIESICSFYRLYNIPVDELL